MVSIMPIASVWCAACDVPNHEHQVTTSRRNRQKDSLTTYAVYKVPAEEAPIEYTFNDISLCVRTKNNVWYVRTESDCTNLLRVAEEFPRVHKDDGAITQICRAAHQRITTFKDHKATNRSLANQSVVECSISDTCAQEPTNTAVPRSPTPAVGDLASPTHSEHGFETEWVPENTGNSGSGSVEDHNILHCRAQAPICDPSNDEPQVQPTAFDFSEPQVQPTASDFSEPQVQPTASDFSEPQVQTTASDFSEPQAQPTASDFSEPQVQPTAHDPSNEVAPTQDSTHAETISEQFRAQLYNQIVAEFDARFSQQEVERLRLVAENERQAENVDSLTGQVSRLNTQLKSSSKSIGIQRTMPSFQPGSVSKAMVATSFESPREVIHKLGIRYQTGQLLPNEYVWQTKFSEPIETLMESQPKQYQRLMQVSRLATKTVLSGMHSSPAEVDKLMGQLAPKRARMETNQFLEGAMVLNIVKSHNDSVHDKERRMHLSSLVSQFKLKDLQQLELVRPITEWLHRQARNHQHVWGAGRPAVQIPITRERIEMYTLQEALAFIYSPTNIQQVSHCYRP